MAAKPTISVIIPAYNQGHFLEAAVGSVLAQTYPSLEALIIDDGSKDNTAEVARTFKDPRVRYIYQDNRGLSAARNTGIRHATGEYFSYLDSDDEFLADKLALLLEAFERQSNLGLAAGQAIPIDEDGCQVGKIFDTGLPENPAELLLGNPLHVGSILVSRSWQEKAGFFDESLRSYEDWDMWLRLARAGCPMKSIARPVSLYRFHTAQMTRDGSQMTEATFAVLDKVFASPDLPLAWQALENQAFSKACLRAAAQGYLAKDFPQARRFLSEAITYDPGLAEDDGWELANRFSSWTELPKIRDPLAFLHSVYTNLPAELSSLANNGRINLGKFAVNQAFESFDNADYSTSRQAIFRALSYQPQLAFNRGLLSIFIRSLKKQKT